MQQVLGHLRQTGIGAVRVMHKFRLLGICLAVAAVPGFASAQQAGSGAGTGAGPSGSPGAASAALGAADGPNPEFGIPIEGWMLYPSVFAGVVFNDNIYSTASNRRSGFGVRLRPSFQAERDIGIHKTSVYANADIQIYPGHKQGYSLFPTYQILKDPTNITGRVGFSHFYTPLPDLTFTLQADYTRSQGGGLFSGGFGAGAPVSSISGATAFSNNGVFSNQFTGLLTAEKKVGERGFVQGKLGAQYIFYDALPFDRWLNTLAGVASVAANNVSRGLNYTAAVRAGYWVTPQLYAFVEPSGDFRRYPNSVSDTNGYRLVAGLGSDLISLFRGEVYGGYQRQISASGVFGSASSPAFGGRLYYYPTPRLTFSLQADQSFTAPAARPLLFFGMPIGYAPSATSRTTQVKGQVDYAIMPYWTTYARLGWGITKSSGVYAANAFVSPYSTTLWNAGWGMNYTFWRNVAVTLEYQFSKSIPSNSSLVNWWAPTTVTQNMVSAGLTYRY